MRKYGFFQNRIQKIIHNAIVLGMMLLAILAVTGCGNTVAPVEQGHTAETGSIDRVPMKDMGNYYLVGGDQLLDKRDPEHQKIIALFQGESTRAVSKINIRLWPGGKVPYYLDESGESGAFSDYERSQINKAITILETNANVDFVEQDEDGEYVYRIHKITTPGIGGYSTVGYSRYANYGFRSSWYVTVMHEMMHCLGFWHEHQRHDRDEYIQINYDNINSRYRHNFSIIPEVDYSGNPYGKVYGEYGFDSIMHYSRFAFSTNGQPSIEVLDNNTTIRRALFLGEADKAGLVALYGPAFKYAKNYLRVHIRGTFNDWGLTEMTLVDDHIWEAEVSFTGEAPAFKFDIKGDWSLNFGDDTGDMYADPDGANILAQAGTYRIRFNDRSKYYELIQEGNRETTIRVHYDTGYGNSISIRGDQAPLSWDSGQDAAWTSENVWVYTTDQLQGSFSCKALINDTIWQSGKNVQAEAGTVVDIYPSF